MENRFAACMPLLTELGVFGGDAFSYKPVAPKGAHMPQRAFQTELWKIKMADSGCALFANLTSNIAVAG